MNKITNLGLALLLVGFSKISCAQNLQWAKSFGSIGTTNSAEAVAVDGSGNVYYTGSFSGTVDFDPGIGVFNLTSTYAGYLTKLDASGNFVWAVQLGGSGVALAFDASNNAYIVGTFDGVRDFDPGVGTFTLTSNAATNDTYVCKLTSAGNFVWAIAIGGPSPDLGKDITVDALGNSYIAGSFGGTVDFDPGIGTSTLTSIGNSNGYLLKLDPSSNFVWVKQINGGTESITRDASGNMYITGSFSGIADFDPGVGTYTLTSGTGIVNGDVYVLKLDAVGDFVLAFNFGTNFDDEIGRSIAVDGTGNMYVGGEYKSPVDFDPSAATTTLTSGGSKDIFIAKYDATGNFIFAKGISGPGGVDGCFDLIVDGAENIYTTGYFVNNADLDPGVGTYTVSNTGQANIFLSKLDSNGDFVFGYAWGATSYNFGNGLALNAAGDLFLAGIFRGTLDFDPGVGTSNLTAIGNGDGFILKFGSSLPTGINTINSNNATINIYPNPFNSQFTIIIDNKERIKAAEFLIYNMLGEEVRKENISTNTFTFNRGTLTEGVYFYKLVQQNQIISTGKLIAE